MLKFGLLLVMLHALHEAHSYHKVHDGWDIISPHRVSAIRGSCVVIPCSYAFPHERYLSLTSYQGMWKRSGWGDVAHSKPYKVIHRDYIKRGYFMGFVWTKNCTWMLSNVRDSDAAHYFFRIEITSFNSYSWSIPDTEVQVVDAHRPRLTVTVAGSAGDKVGFCSVTHSCPYYPPTLTWNHNGVVLTRSQRLSDWEWMTYSILHLRPQSTTQEVRCTVTYHGGQTLSTAI